ncbi:protein CANDIDATE G-PROTEIN COUPLED RECEPTOR 7-like [Musa acuminata AAA Group]|uniref:protein CANDIDATE G-PROTEIN COUPLED RECEPTOR 7-like n=1 Tax=Musa acuminata AAA Group TaxID=214697 RepID=UPI0031E22333
MAMEAKALVLAMMIMLSWIWAVRAEIREMEVWSDARSIIPFDEFGFTRWGGLELNVTGIAFSSALESTAAAAGDMDLSQLGFFLCTRDAWLHVLRQLQDLDITCALQSDLVRVVYSFDRLLPPPNPSGVAVARASTFRLALNLTDSPGQFTLVFANCLPQLRVSMSVRSAMFNRPDPFDPSRRAYLSAGAAALPLVYSLLFFAYAALATIWAAVLLRRRRATFGIHYFMLAVVVLKAFNLLCEAEDKSYIERTGSAHGWDVLFYIFSFLKGISLFTLIVLIGTGWSFLKPYLQDREKKVLMAVIPLQVVANIAQVAIDESGPYARDWITWKQVFLLVDVICCCAVLFPIVWSIKNLREAARTDGKAAVNLMKLTLFRQYYVVVICYIYFTRVVVYALVTITSYRYLWTSVLAGELATLAFYIFTGFRFRPEAHNPYLAIDDDDEEEAAAEALRLDDEFEL